MTPKLPREKARRLIAAVAARHGVGVLDITSPGRLPHVVVARHAAMRTVARQCPTLRLKEMAHLFARHHSTILYAIGRLGARSAAG